LLRFFAARGENRYGCILATCSVGGENLNAFMVRDGLARDCTKYSREYIREEDIAREQHKGG
jgi:endonuclease YncB( thermonuclease family)